MAIFLVGGLASGDVWRSLGMGLVFGGLILIGRFAWAPPIFRKHPFIMAWVGAVVIGATVGGALDALRNSKGREDCRASVAALTRMKTNGELTYENGDSAARASAACKSVGLYTESEQAKTIAQEIEASRAKNARGVAKGSPLDPSSCPKGNVQFDRTTGERVQCTGPATGTGTAGGCPTIAQYQSVQNGMTRDDVVATLGEGEQAVEQNFGGMTGEILEWKCTGFLRAGVLIVQLQNGRVVQKSQQGLR
jgi:hypothetical protein